MALVYLLLSIVFILYLYLGVLQVFNSVNNVVLTFLRHCLKLCNTTPDRINMPMDTPLISYFRALLSRWQNFNYTDTGYMITLVHQNSI